MKKFIIILSVVSIFAAGCLKDDEPLQDRKQPKSDNKVSNKTADRTTAKVTRVVDGDTYQIETGEKIRLLGIDTPEKYESNKLEKDSKGSKSTKETIKKLGKLASDYSKKLVEGKNVILEKEPNYQDKDRYGRLLRYIYLEDGTCVNAKLILDGYAYVYDKFEISKLEEFKKYYHEARDNRRGLWGNVEGLQNFEK